MKPPAGLVVTVIRFIFIGNTKVHEDQLQASVATWINHPIDFVELQKAAAATAALYRDAGRVVRVYLPKQDIDNGEVTIRIVEAVFGSVPIEAAEGIRVSQEAVRARVLKAQTPCEVLHTEAIDRSLLILEDTPGVRVRGHLAEGQNDGETDLVLQLDPQPLLAGDAGVDNTGSHSTGANRLTANIYANSPLRWGDLASANAIRTVGSEYLRAAWTAPLGSDGLRAGVSQSYLEYWVVTSEFSTLGLKGHSATTGLDLSYPLIRSTSKNLYLNLNQNFRSFYNQASGASTSDYSLDVASVGLSGNRFDNFSGGGVLSGSVVGPVTGQISRRHRTQLGLA